MQGCVGVHLEFMAVCRQRLHLAAEGTVLYVQRMLLTVGARLNHLHSYLNITQCLRGERKRRAG